MVEQDDRLGAGEVEEDPRSEDSDEDDERDRVPEEREEEDEKRDGGVVGAEVVEVALGAGGGFG